MILNELPDGSTLQLEVSKGKSKISFDSVISGVIDKPNQYGNIVYIPLLKSGDMVLRFENVKIVVIVKYSDDGREYKFNIAICYRGALDGEQYHFLCSPDDVKAINHREAVRVPFTESAIMSYNSGRPMECYTKDISITGISLSIRQTDLAIKNYSHILISFEYPSSGIRYKLNATVVRVEPNEEKNVTVLGCVFDKEYSEVNQLVNKLQRNRRA